MRKKKAIAIIFALLAAVFYAINMPFSKSLLAHVPETMMAGFLYLGAGVGVGIMFLFSLRKKEEKNLLTKADLPYTIGMIVLDIAAPISLMYGLSHTTASSASLLNNFEIVATAVIALCIFKEVISKRLWIAIAFVTASSIVLTCGDFSELKFSWGALFVLLAAVLWGFENNCTRKISSRNVYEIVTLKGLFSGTGSLIVGLILGEHFPKLQYLALTMLLGFVAYGLSIFFYIKAQKDLGAAKTSAFYAVAPFVGAFLSFVILKESFSLQFLIALLLMLVGSVIASVDTILLRHKHMHTHVITHTHDGTTHSHEVTHEHEHSHVFSDANHTHIHL